MATNWTDAQLSAITSKDKTLLISAAAGSGKTATLTERIIRKLTDKNAPADISDMLIVTFTRASAADLRAKISAALRDALAKEPENTHLTKQLVKLSNAHISTIDSFYLDAVRKNFAKLSLSSSFRIADQSETDLLAKNIMDDVILSFYEMSEAFPALCECFEKIKDTGDVMREVLIDLYEKCMHVPEGVEYLLICAKECAKGSKTDFLSTKYGTIIKDYALPSLEDFLEYYNSSIDFCNADEKLSHLYSPALESDRALCLALICELKKDTQSLSYEVVSQLLRDHNFARLGSLKKEFATDDSLFCKDLRTKFKKLIEDLYDDFFCYSKEDFAHFLEKTSQNLALLYEILREFHSEFMAEKKRRNVLELTDVKRYALELFVNPDNTPTECALEYSQLFSEIYIDEYQDVDPVQDAIFCAISTPTNRFMVGDIKQSIYSFRGAEPSLFAHYRSTFAPISDENADSCTIFMSENFRCSKPIIDFTNLICSPLFYACKDSIGYTSEDDLVYGLSNDPELYEGVKVAYFAKDSKQKDDEDNGDDTAAEAVLTAAEAEAEYVAERIEEILKNGKKANGEKILPKDIALLFRSNNASNRFAEALSRRGIKSTAADATEYFQNPDVLMVLCILNAVDNPQRDIYLAGALRSPIFNFSLEDILLISKLGCDSDSLYDKLCIAAEGTGDLAERCADFNDRLNTLRRISTSLPIDKFLKHLFSTDSFVASGLFSEKSSSGEGGNLLRLYEYARSFEAGSFKGLYNFIEFINTIIENGTTLESASKDISDDCVTLTTIHKSKGLEFPVCFVCGTGSDMISSHKNPLPFDYGMGIAMDLSDNTGFAHYESPLKKILELRADLLSREEEMRVLYVALTRAREQLYITGSFSRRTLPNIRAAAQFNSRFNCRHSVMTSASFLDWVLARIYDKPQEANLTEFQPSDIKPYNAQAEITLRGSAENPELTRELEERFAFVYPYSALRRIPAKLSISRLAPDVLDENDTSFSPFEERKPTEVPGIFLDTDAKSSSSAERGTATHQFLQFCDFAYAREHGVDAMIKLLIEKRFIPAEFETLIYKKEIERLLNSTFCSDILCADSVIRERRFNILLPASHFTEDEELRTQIANEMIAVQGVIDLILIGKDGSIGLYDYKTDRLSREELADDTLATAKMRDMHGNQLRYYAEAIKQLFGKYPDTVAIYSTCAGKLYELV